LIFGFGEGSLYLRTTVIFLINGSDTLAGSFGQRLNPTHFPVCHCIKQFLPACILFVSGANVVDNLSHSLLWRTASCTPADDAEHAILVASEKQARNKQARNKRRRHFWGETSDANYVSWCHADRDSPPFSSDPHPRPSGNLVSTAIASY